MINLNSRPALAAILNALVAMALLSACAAPSIPLNSDRIEARFGNYAVRVLHQDESLRISSLESSENGQATTRTLAITQFADPAPAIADVAARIRAGGSIGSSFLEAGWTIDKPLEFIGTIDVGSDAAIVAELMKIDLPVSLAMHSYRFDVARGSQRIHFATITELHHPDYLREQDLAEIYRSRFAMRAASAAERLSETRRILLALSGSASP